MRALPWPPLEQPVRLPWAALDCRPYTVPPIFKSHLTKVPAPPPINHSRTSRHVLGTTLSAARTTLRTHSTCYGRSGFTHSPEPHGRPVGGRYRFMPHDCEWRHAGMRAIQIEEVLDMLGYLMECRMYIQTVQHTALETLKVIHDFAA
ncbi:hypothetical protein BD626DRAFT_48325 [Schizophyllum amplum]|uniref:Uncharacterized protein n=1 Tax=Schizophyllum amplum TaxID=97359 RepID=A0A550BSS3_9AGAR|nr:hypothetical protein BD626DRAFT_48325 [Auriculariopsis ampla]